MTMELKVAVGTALEFEVVTPSEKNNTSKYSRSIQMSRKHSKCFTYSNVFNPYDNAVR